jgi:hypothetical protein
MTHKIIISVAGGILMLVFSIGLLMAPLNAKAAGGITHSSVADFSQNCGVLTGTIPTPLLTDTRITNLAGGTVELALSLDDHFTGTALSTPPWESGNWNGTNVPLVSSSILTVPTGTWVRSQSSYTHAIIEAVAEFGPGSNQHIGFAPVGGLDMTDKFFIFSTFSGDGNLWARAADGSTITNTNLLTLPTGLHTYRIEWVALNASTDQIIFYLDGSSLAQIDVPSAGATNYRVYLSNDGAADLRVDRVQVEPGYVASGTYTSCALDAGAANGWQTISWDATLTTSTSLSVEARVSTNGSTWTSWNNVSNGGIINSTLARYAQYRLLLATSNSQVRPLINSVTLNHNTVPTLSIADAAITEGDTGTVGLTFTVSLAGSISQTVTVNYATANNTAIAPSDYISVSGVLTFTPNVANQTIPVIIQSETVTETNETFVVNLSNAVNANIGDSQAIGTIIDDDSEIKVFLPVIMRQ